MVTSSISVSSASLALALERAVGDSGFEALTDGNLESLALRSRILAARSALAQRDPRDVFGSADDPTTSLMQTWLAREGGTHRGELQPIDGGYEAKFDNIDPLWIWSLHNWIKGLVKHPFAEPIAHCETIANDYSIAVLGDWGTGMYGAPICAHSILVANPAPQMVLHLGDIYYAGDGPEVQQRFLDMWPRVPGACHRALNGNHEMYTGGSAYFGQLLGDPMFLQRASCFAQLNDDWLLIHLDTAYDEHDLHGSQAAWAQALAASHPAHRLMLFSHHQPFSAFESGGPKLLKKLMPLLTSGRVAAWYWGHEHSCIRYEPHPFWKTHGRCIGHSGFPYFRFVDPLLPAKTSWVPFNADPLGRPAGLILDGPNNYVDGHETLYGPNGWLMLELQGRTVHESYRAADGSVLAEFDIESDR